MANKDYAAISSQPAGSNTKIRAEQIRSEDGFASLAVDLDALKGQVKDIIGAADYKENITGDLDKVQLVDLAHHLNAASGSAELVVKLASAMSGAVQMYSTLNVDGEATLASATVEDITATHVVFAGAGGALEGSANLVWDGTDLVVGSAKVSDLTSTHVVVAGASGAISGSGALVFDGTDLIAASAKVSDLTSTRVVFAGTDGALVDDAKMTFSAGVLTISGSTFSKDVSIAGNLTVLGATTTVDTENLLVKDAKIVVSSGGIVDGAGIYLASDTAGENIRWDVAGDRWVASDKFAADTMQALDLSSALVWADASGNLVEVPAQDLADAIEARLVAGVGVSIVEAGGFITASIGQAVGTGDSVTFANITDSALTANRIVKTAAASGLLESAAIMDFVTGTVNQVVATAGAFGNVVLSLPQDIHTGASPQFTALNVGTAHDIMDIGGDLYIKSTGGLVLSGADGQYAVSEAGDSALFATNFGASETIVGALNVLKAAATTASAAKSVVELGSAVTAGDSVVGISIAGFTPDNGMVFVNGQLMLSGSAGAKDYSIDSGALKFSFNLESGDVVVAQRA